MSKKMFLAYVLLVCLNVCCSEKKAIIAYKSNIIDLGIMDSSKQYIDSIVIKSVGNKILEVKEITSDCTCTVIRTKNKSVRPGDSIFINYRFQPPLIGNFRHSITIQNNSVNDPELLFVIQGTVIDRELMED